MILLMNIIRLYPFPVLCFFSPFVLEISSQLTNLELFYSRFSSSVVTQMLPGIYARKARALNGNIAHLGEVILTLGLSKRCNGTFEDNVGRK